MNHKEKADHIIKYFDLNKFDTVLFIYEDTIDEVYKVIFENEKVNEKSNNEEYFSYLGCYYELEDDDEKAVKYYKMAIDKGDNEAVYNLGYYYQQNRQFKEMMECYIKAIDNGHMDAMNNLGYHYHMLLSRDHFVLGKFRNKREESNYGNMLKYYHMAIKNGCKMAAFNMCQFHYGMADVIGMKKYYEMIKKDKDMPEIFYNVYEKIVMGYDIYLDDG
jgi:TPR repeat protein